MHLSQSVRHASLVTQESCEVHRPAGVIPRPRLHLAPVPVAPLVGQETQMSMPGGRELSVGLGTEEDGGQSWGHPGENGWMVPRPELEKVATGPRLRLSGLQCLHLSAGKICQGQCLMNGASTKPSSPTGFLP